MQATFRITSVNDQQNGGKQFRFTTTQSEAGGSTGAPSEVVLNVGRDSIGDLELNKDYTISIEKFQSNAPKPQQAPEGLRPLDKPADPLTDAAVKTPSVSASPRDTAPASNPNRGVTAENIVGKPVEPAIGSTNIPGGTSNAPSGSQQAVQDWARATHNQGDK